jgi:hypothetical protein
MLIIHHPPSPDIPSCITGVVLTLLGSDTTHRSPTSISFFCTALHPTLTLTLSSCCQCLSYPGVLLTPLDSNTWQPPPSPITVSHASSYCLHSIPTTLLHTTVPTSPSTEATVYPHFDSILMRNPTINSSHVVEVSSVGQTFSPIAIIFCVRIKIFFDVFYPKRKVTQFSYQKGLLDLNFYSFSFPHLSYWSAHLGKRTNLNISRQLLQFSLNIPLYSLKTSWSIKIFYVILYVFVISCPFVWNTKG